jgi:cytochrome c biogenesis protein
LNELVKIPEGLGTITIKSFEPMGTYQGVDIGPTLTAELTPKAGEPQIISLPLTAPKFDAMRKGAVIISAHARIPEKETKSYAVLQVTRDPGVSLVYSGFILMIVGLFISFFMSHQQIVVEVCARDEQRTLLISGTANKNKLGLETRLSRLAERLKDF